MQQEQSLYHPLVGTQIEKSHGSIWCLGTVRIVSSKTLGHREKLPHRLTVDHIINKIMVTWAYAIPKLSIFNSLHWHLISESPHRPSPSRKDCGTKISLIVIVLLDTAGYAPHLLPMMSIWGLYKWYSDARTLCVAQEKKGENYQLRHFSIFLVAASL